MTKPVKRYFPYFRALAVVAITLAAPAAPAQEWPTTGTELCNITSAKINVRGVSDGAGGADFVWLDKRDDSLGIYAQRVNQNGEITWSGSGVPVYLSLGDLFYAGLEIASDGSGGAIIGWNDIRSGSSGIFAQRLSSNGSIMWGAAGVTISPDTHKNLPPKVVADGTGGAIILWSETDNTSHTLHAQKLSNMGDKLWGANGVVLSGSSDSPEIISDDNGGAIIAYHYENNIYAQHVDDDGEKLWGDSALVVCSEPHVQQFPRLTSDSAGGCIIAWDDQRGTSPDIYAQRINSAGIIQWVADGVPVCTYAETQWQALLISDGAGGAIISWEDHRDGLAVYAQKLDSSGVAQWAVDGVSLGTDVSTQSFDMTTNGFGGAVVAWKRKFSGSITEVVAQEIDSEGAILHPPGGRLISPYKSFLFPAELVSGADGQVTIGFKDDRSGQFNIYATEIRAPGTNSAIPDWPMFENPTQVAR